MRWRIYYADGVVSGFTRKAWIAAPDTGVQVVAIMEAPARPYPDRRVTGFLYCGRADRTFYTGVDEYDPLSYGHIKRGSLLSKPDYDAVWEHAHGDR